MEPARNGADEAVLDLVRNGAASGRRTLLVLMPPMLALLIADAAAAAADADADADAGTCAAFSDAAAAVGNAGEQQECKRAGHLLSSAVWVFVPVQSAESASDLPFVRLRDVALVRDRTNGWLAVLASAYPILRPKAGEGQKKTPRANEDDRLGWTWERDMLGDAEEEKRGERVSEDVGERWCAKRYNVLGTKMKPFNPGPEAEMQAAGTAQERCNSGSCLLEASRGLRGCDLGCGFLVTLPGLKVRYPPYQWNIPSNGDINPPGRRATASPTVWLQRPLVDRLAAAFSGAGPKLRSATKHPEDPPIQMRRR
ncbi:hypothetical protein TARUN_1114 [Trichoderma arundinaceum]|uniref:Uncharacterized protein n=1 Tax=Trichoderma arundinaceum TaxID=490622 RepID=A0A395NZU8_TRIAR|nr:hypothetical protein TARUN_1114 [Trichoderma arundinaceum]